MANPFLVEPANPLAALMLGVQGYKQGQQNVKDSALREAGQLYASGDIKAALAAAAKGGSLEALLGFGRMANQERDFSFRQSEAGRSQQNADRSFGLQERQLGQSATAQAATRDLARKQFEFNKSVANRADIKTVKDAFGNERLVRIERDGKIIPLDTGTATAPTNPYAAPGKMTDGQSSAALYADRMLNSEKILADPASISAATDVTQLGLSKVPGIGNFMISNNYQKYEQAKRDFVNATLRRESGAVINEQEFANAERQYFPRPGDSPKVIEQKARNREAAIRGIARAAGPSYQPPTSPAAPAKSSGAPPAPAGEVVDWQTYFGSPPR